MLPSAPCIETSWQRLSNAWRENGPATMNSGLVATSASRLYQDVTYATQSSTDTAPKVADLTRLATAIEGICFPCNMRVR